MTARLPTRFIVIPVEALFRPDPLQPELQETWLVLRGISWVNEYRFTPPVSIDELLSLHQRKISKQALLTRLERLQHGWLEVERQPGRKNIYRAVVPPIPVSEETASWAERPSMNRASGEDSTRVTENSDTEDAAAPTSQVHLTSPIDVVVGTDSLHLKTDGKEQQQYTPLRERVRELLREIGIGGSNLERLVSSGITLETAADWLLWAEHVNPKPQNPPGIAVRALLQNPNAAPPASPKQLAEWREWDERKRRRAADEETSPKREEVNACLASPCLAKPNDEEPNPAQTRASQIWGAALAELQLQMTKATFETWFKSTLAVSYDEQTAELVISVRNAHAQQWLQHRFIGMIQRTLDHILGKRAQIVFQTRH